MSTNEENTITKRKMADYQVNTRACCMMDVEKKTTQINTIKYRPLEVEWKTNHPYVRQSTGGFKRVDEHVVAIIAGKSAWHERAYLVGMSPRTALNLLAWLEDNRSTLEELAAKEEA